MKTSIILFGCLMNFFSLFAQFPNVKWQYALPAPSFGSAASADLDKDGKPEIVFTTYTNDGKAHCLNGEDGSPLWVTDIGGCGDVAPLIVDADGDDTLDVIVNGSCNPEIFCINGYTGQIKWRQPSGGGDSPPTAADMDGDGKLEILYCNFSGDLRIINGEDGSVNKIIPVDPHQGPIQTEPTLVDLNQDGKLDIIIASHYNTSGLYVWAYNYQTADTFWTHYESDTSTYNAYHGGAVADIDQDGKPEYVIGSNNGKVKAFNTEDGSLLWMRPIPLSNMAAISMADLDGNGSIEVVVTNNDWVNLDERIWILNGMDGSMGWSLPTAFSSFRGCAIGDINGNDTLDLVAGFSMGDVMAVEPWTGQIWQLNIGPYLPSGLPYYEADHGPLIADFDQNGTMDVFITGGYGTYTPDSQNVGKAFLIEAGIGTCPQWLSFRRDVFRSGFLDWVKEDSICNPVTGISGEVGGNSLPALFPNPANEKLHVVLGKYKTFEMYNSSGIWVDIGTIEEVIDTKDFPSGLYWVRFRDERGEGVSVPVVVQH